jgi:hypothetical protein
MCVAVKGALHNIFVLGSVSGVYGSVLSVTSKAERLEHKMHSLAFHNFSAKDSSHQHIFRATL